MMRLCRHQSAALCALLMLGPAQAQDDRHQWSLEVELDARSAEDSGKLSVTGDREFARAAFVYRGTIKPTLSVDAVVDAVDDGAAGIDITEAYITWRPVPTSPFRHGVRVGAFFPPLSLENAGPAWTSPYTRSFSAINTWIGEELRTIGSEWSVTRALGPRARQREIRMIAAGYYGNDPAGAILSWRGWALHGRQSRLGDALALPPLPQIGPGRFFSRQAPDTEPFVETDHAPGYYYGAEWRLGRRALLAAMHYDNRADPLSLRNGNYGWTTRFDHLGVQLELPARLGLIMQWMDGTTVMGPEIDGIYVVDNGFASWFALVTREHGRHRWSLRLDDFEVYDYDPTPLDSNDETGQAITAAWRYSSDSRWSLGLEWRSFDLRRPAFAYFDKPVESSGHLLNLDVRFSLGFGHN